MVPARGSLFLVTTFFVVTFSVVGAAPAFGPANPFYKPSALPFGAPPFDKIHDGDYQPAIEAGMAEQLAEIRKIAGNPASPTFENTIVAMEKTGVLLRRANAAFNAVSAANTNPALEEVRRIEAPRLAAHQDAILLDAALFARVSAIYDKRASLSLDPESLRLIEFHYKRFVHAGANLSEPDKAKLKKLNEEESTLSTSFSTRLLAATRAGAWTVDDKSLLAGLTDAEIAAAAEAAKNRKRDGWVIALQNTTQQPALAELTNRTAREALYKAGWTRASGSDGNDTREVITRLAALRSEKAKLLGFPTYAAWKLEDQMAKTPETARKFLDSLVAPAAANVAREAKEIQASIDNANGGFQVQPWDWEYYAAQVRKTRYDLDEKEVRPYFELYNVLENGVFYAANQLYGLTFKRRTDVPVYHPDVRIYEVTGPDGKPLALWYCDYFKRDNKNGGAWSTGLSTRSALMGTMPVVMNVANLPKPAPGEPALISWDGVRTMFHEFGHALHGMFSDTRYSGLAGTAVPRDFVEFPSQFNEHWMSYPAVFSHFARHYKTGQPMPAELESKLRNAEKFNQGYAMTELLAAAELDMQWHTLPAGEPISDVAAFEKRALEKTHLDIAYAPPRYNSTYFLHIWSNGYSAGYYAYLWSAMLDNDAFRWFEEHGGLTRENGDRFRRMILSRGNTEDLAKMYATWRGAEPSIQPMLVNRGLAAANP